MRPNKTIKNLLLVIAAVFTYDATTTLIMFGCGFVLPAETLDAHYFLLDTVSTTILMGVFLMWLVSISRTEQQSFLSRQTFHSGYWIISIPIIGLGLSALSGIWLGWAAENLQDIPVIAESLESFDETWSTLGSEAYVWELLSIVIVGPIVEELLFRGVVFHYLEKIKGGWFPIVFSALAFGLWHREPVQIVYTAMIGLLYGMIYFKVRDLRVTILLHMFNNLLSTLPPALNTPVVQEKIWDASYIMIIPALALVIQVWAQPGRQVDGTQ